MVRNALKNKRPNDRRVRGFRMPKAMERSEMAIESPGGAIF